MSHSGECVPATRASGYGTLGRVAPTHSSEVCHYTQSEVCNHTPCRVCHRTPCEVFHRTLNEVCNHTLNEVCHRTRSEVYHRTSSEVCNHTPSGAAPLHRAGEYLCSERGTTSAPSGALPLHRARRTGKFDFTDTIRFAVRFKFSLTENLMKKHRGVLLRARLSALFEQRY